MASNKRPGSVRAWTWPLIDAKSYSIVIGSASGAQGGYQ
jgi:hypothetical protein